MSITWGLEFAQAKDGSVLEYCHLVDLSSQDFVSKYRKLRRLLVSADIV